MQSFKVFLFFLLSLFLFFFCYSLCTLYSPTLQLFCTSHAVTEHVLAVGSISMSFLDSIFFRVRADDLLQKKSSCPPIFFCEHPR